MTKRWTQALLLGSLPAVAGLMLWAMATDRSLEAAAQILLPLGCLGLLLGMLSQGRRIQE